MTTTTNAIRIAFFAAAGAAACTWAPHAVADDTVQTELGGQADVGSGQQWTISALQPSADPISHPTAGTLWEATATSAPAQGGIPIVPGFSAQSPAGDTYPVLWSVPTPLGINPSALPAGGSATGKFYFDITGPTPDRVTYTSDDHNLASWVQPVPAPGGAGASAPAPAATAYTPPAQAGGPAALPAAPGATAPAAAGNSGTPAAAPE
ncbi:MAG: hypothetical protein QG597_2284, partial [Actinomycetota bacterium]|nr:hypothetical protein [Actinomycetota bacterium]